MSSERFDAIVIGTGQAGPSLAGRLAASGRRTAVIERGPFGGTCVNTGCIPTKALVASARVAHLARRAADFGVSIAGAVSVDMAAVHARMQRIAAASRDGLAEWLHGEERIEVVAGHARFVGPDRVAVGDRMLQAPQIFCNVGARPAVPDLDGSAEVPLLTNVDMMAVDHLPEHLIVVGGSYVGLEFGQVFRRFGSRVTILERGPRLIGREDEDVSAAIREVLEGEGVTVHTDADCIGFARRGDRVVARVTCDDGPDRVAGSHVLLAVGRAPNTDDLGTAAAGLATDDRGYLVTDDRLRTNVEGIWALGDCNGRGAFTHTAYNDYEVVADQLFGAGRRKVTDRIPCYGLYVDPPLGRVGLNRSQARAAGRDVLVGRRPMTKVGRAFERSETQGFLEVLVDKDSERILGASLLGIEADEVVHCLLTAMYAGAPYTVLRDAVHIHPTVAELLPTLLEDLEPLD